MKYLAVLLLALFAASCREEELPDPPPAFNTTTMELVLTCDDAYPTRIFFDETEPGYYAVALGNGMKLVEGVTPKDYCDMLKPQINPGPNAEQ